MQVPCHRKEERCFCVNGEPMPICSRCLSILIGILTVPLFLIYPIPLIAGVLLQIPMLWDGFTQLKGLRKSNNFLRCITGLGSGIGLAIGITSIFSYVVDFSSKI